MKSPKFSVIGAGGGFVVGLIHDICLTPNLHGCTVSLMDIHERRLDSACTICKRYAEECGVNIRIEKTLDRRESLKDADFVVTIALVDGPRRLKEGWEISLKQGYRWAGSYHILYDEPFWLNYYQLQLFESITRDILTLCPQAWHLLVSNPVLAATTYLQRKYPDCKMVGLCHGFAHAYSIAARLGFDAGKVVFEIPGVNHFVWMNRLTHNGNDLFPLIDRWVQDRTHGRTTEMPDLLSPKTMELYRKFGAIPIGDTSNWTGASWPWWYHPAKDKEGDDWNEQMGKHWFGYIDAIGSTAGRYEKIAADTTTTIASAFGLGKNPTGEPMIPIAESITRDIPRVIVVNTLNTENYIPGIPQDFEVEIGALVSRAGIRGVKPKPLPKSMLAHILRDRVAPVEVELEAYEKGSRKQLVQLALMDKWTRSEAHANALIDEIFALPYHEELRRHYR
jgi:alpha-galactosidase